MGERQSIAELILRDAEDKFKDQITFHYNCSCKARIASPFSHTSDPEVLLQRIDFEAKTVFFEDAKGEDIAMSYDLLVGADGYNSVVRQEMEKLGESIVTKRYRSKRGYKSIRNLPFLDGGGVASTRPALRLNTIMSCRFGV